MLTVRLTDELEHRLDSFARSEHQPKSQVVKDALLFYFENKEEAKKQTAYTLGKELFGKYGSGDGKLSTNYKEKLKEKLHAKNAH
ncbi:MAG: ribbon-helix-helix protein, CopG family [Campylobacterales bacterium]